MASPLSRNDVWPDLNLPDWTATRDTLRLWTQMVGKTALSLAPMTNHWWQTTLYVNARGLVTQPLPYQDRVFELEFDFIDHRLIARSSDGSYESFELRPCTVKDFFAEYQALLKAIDVKVHLWPMPVEVFDDDIPFDRDTVHSAYDPVWANRFYRALVQADRLLRQFRGRFIGKCSPVHFYWGGFDLACSRFSGRRAPRYTAEVPHLNRRIMAEAYSHEVSSAGFWPGGGPYPDPAFYSYAYPEPPGFSEWRVRPKEARYQKEAGEFLLRWDDVRTAENPDELVLQFLQSSYEAAAERGKWDRSALERGREPAALEPELKETVERAGEQEEELPAGCDHLREARRGAGSLRASGWGCKECLEMGSSWVHLRVCMGCGHVGCCDNSPNRHATRHFRATQHPVIRSFEPGEDWAYCYLDDAVEEGFPRPEEELPVFP